MRINLTAILLTFVFLNVSAGVSAQRISLRVKNAPLKVVFEEIKKQTGYFFWYEDDLLKGTSKVSVDLRNVGLEEGLDACMKGQPLTYSIKDKVIVVKAKEVSLKDKVMGFFKGVAVSGKVVDEKGVALPGVNVKLKGTDKVVVTDKDGNYSIEVPDAGAVLQFSFVGYQVTELPAGSSPLVVTLRILSAQLEDVSVVNTGYQSLPKERATGSFVQIDNELLNRRVSTNILDRIDGIAPGVFFNGMGSNTIRTSALSPRNPGINIRGQSTINAPTDPLIVLDNFPYEGEISNINPNDIESITILKDAAAASIWGARAGNGVIVITTKKGKLNQKMKIELNSNVTIGNKPDLYYDKNYLNSADYIEVEKLLFSKGLFDTDIANVTAQTPVSPVVDLLAKQRALPAADLAGRSAIDAQINALAQNDVRNDFDKYVYQKSVSQQYSLGLRGGTDNMTYALSVGYDKNRSNVIRNDFDRTSINFLSTYKPLKNLEVIAGLNYSLSNTQDNNTQNLYGSNYNIGGKYSNLYPYAQLADADGNPLSIVKGYKPSYISSSMQKGFLDWNYRPLDEVQLSDRNTKVNDILFRAGAKYQVISGLSAEVNYQKEKQLISTYDRRNQLTYSTRDLINRFSQYNATTNTISYIFPVGDVLNLGSYDWNTYNVRGQLNYSQTFEKNQINGLVGAEIRELKTEGFGRTSNGYSDQFGTSVSNLSYNTSYPVNPSGSSMIAAPDGDVSGTQYRYISYFANVGYTYNDRYTFTLSGRKDGANIFGANTNDKVTPLWSAGIGWDISKENFYHVDWLSYLKMRLTYGYNGNVYNGSAYLTGSYSTSPITGAPRISINVAPNPELRWEKVQNINLGIDFSLLKSRISGSIELYRKNSKDLLQRSPLAPQTGFTSVLSNAGSMWTQGIDIFLQSKNLDNDLKWTTTLIVSGLKDEITKYDVAQTATSIQSITGSVALVGKSLYGIYAYKWGGLDPTNGDPQGYLNGQISKNYTGIINNFNPDSLVYRGSSRPTLFGTIRNDFSFRGISLSFSIAYKFNYFIRKPSLTLNYQDVLGVYQNSDYSLRWQKPGDEINTSVPSMVYPSNSNRNTFYTYSDALILSGDHIRLQDIRIGYEIASKFLTKTPLKHLQVYAYSSNLGIIWRSNKEGIDPDNYGFRSSHDLPNPFTIAFGISSNF